MHVRRACDALCVLMWWGLVLHQLQQCGAAKSPKKLELVKNGVASPQRGTRFWTNASDAPQRFFSVVGTGKDASFKCSSATSQGSSGRSYCKMSQNVSISCTSAETLTVSADLLADSQDFAIVVVTAVGANDENVTFVNLNSGTTNQKRTGSLFVNATVRNITIELAAYARNGNSLNSGAKKVSVTLPATAVCNASGEPYVESVTASPTILLSSASKSTLSIESLSYLTSVTVTHSATSATGEPSVSAAAINLHSVSRTWRLAERTVYNPRATTTAAATTSSRSVTCNSSRTQSVSLTTKNSRTPSSTMTHGSSSQHRAVRHRLPTAPPPPSQRRCLVHPLRQRGTPSVNVLAPRTPTSSPRQ